MLDTIGHTALETLTSIIKPVSPILANVFNTPLASVGLSLLGGVFGIKSGDISAIINAIQGDPEAKTKILQLTFEHEEALQKMVAQNYQTEVDDRKSAREREVQIKDHVPTILAIGFLFNYAAIQFYCVTHPSNMVDIMSARFQDVLMLIMSYYFGSTFEKFNKS